MAKETRTYKDRARARRGVFDLLLLEQKIAKRFPDGRGPESVKRGWRSRRARIAAKQRLITEAALSRGRGYGFRDLLIPRGMARVKARWVGIVAIMEPGRWYGAGVLGRAVGHRKAVWISGGKVLLFVDRALNPNYRAQGLMEPKYLFRLNRWGLSLREKVLDNWGLEYINVLELDGARPDLWK